MKKTFLMTLLYSFSFLSPLFFYAPAQAASTLEKIAESGTITLGFSHLPPFAYFDDNKRPVGYSIDLCLNVVEAIKKELNLTNLTTKFLVLAPPAHIPALVSGEIDLDCDAMTDTEERREKITFATPTFIAEIRLQVHHGSDIRSLKDLKGKKVVVTKGTTSETLLNELDKGLTLNVEVISGRSHRDAFSLFEQKKGDAFILDDIFLYALQLSSKNPENFSIKRLDLGTEYFALAMRKNDPQFKTLVDAEIMRLITEGEIYAIYKKWFESPIPPKKINLRYPMSDLLRALFEKLIQNNSVK